MNNFVCLIFFVPNFWMKVIRFHVLSIMKNATYVVFYNASDVVVNVATSNWHNDDNTCISENLFSANFLFDFFACQTFCSKNF
jgi:hypothetical protein